MTETAVEKPLRVSPSSASGTPWPYLVLPYSRLDEVRGLLDRHGICFTVSENIISVNGGPETASIHFGRNGDAAAVQAALDSSF